MQSHYFRPCLSFVCACCCINAAKWDTSAVENTAAKAPQCHARCAAAEANLLSPELEADEVSEGAGVSA